MSVVLTMDSTISIWQQLENNWPFQQPFSQLYTIHPVADAPNFATPAPERLYILQMQEDRFNQVHPDDVLALVSVIFRGPGTANRQRVKILWVPHRLSCASFLQYLRMHWYCARPSLICFAYVNGILWHEMDNAIRTIECGDHLHLQVRSDRESWEDVSFSKCASRGQRLFQSSSEEAEEPRTRSRSRGQPGTEDSHSMLQTQTIKTRRSVGADAVHLVGSETPHVLDRWCADPNWPVDRVSHSRDRGETSAPTK